jgi:hypothetical protein
MDEHAILRQKQIEGRKAMRQRFASLSFTKEDQDSGKVARPGQRHRRHWTATRDAKEGWSMTRPNREIT